MVLHKVNEGVTFCPGGILWNFGTLCLFVVCVHPEAKLQSH